MPSRHSKNAGDRHHFTYTERCWADGGTQKIRLGTDSQLPFGNCAMCLQAAKEPMATPSGHIYCRECILEYLLTKTKELKRQRAAYEAQQQAAVQRSAAEQEEQQKSAVDKFVKSHGSAGAVSASTSGAAAAAGAGGAATSTALVVVAEPTEPEKLVALGKRPRTEADEARLEAEKKRVKEAMAAPVDKMSKADHKEILKRTSFWLPQHAPEHMEEAIAAPEARPRSPMGGNLLRAKDLIPVRFTLDGDKASADGKGAKGHIICAVTRREIHHQQCVLLAKSGQVMLKSALDEFAIPTMTCPVTGAKFKKSDVVELVVSASGFAASGEVEAKKYQPVMM